MNIDHRPARFVLFVDDDLKTVKYFQEIFEPEFPVLTATTVQEARRIVYERSQEIAIILSDQRMPAGTGVELLAEIRREFPEIIRVLTTAYASLSTSLEAINLGRIFAYVTKPWDIDSMRATLHSAYREFDKGQALLALAGTIAHEMRNPLGQVKFSLESIQEELPAPGLGQAGAMLATADLESLHGHVAKGLTAIRRGGQIIELMLNEAGGKAIQPQGFAYFSASAIVRRAVDEYGFDSPEDRQRVSVVVKADFTVKVDETACLFVLFNLLKNALYYFRQTPGAVLVFTVDAHRILVRDTGPGIPANVMARLFGAFATAGKAGGTGLGLAYCKRAMQAFGGDIRCTSVVDEFTEFVLSFPEIAPSEVVAQQHQRLEDITRVLQGKRILIVDEQPSMRRFTRAHLDGLGARVDEAENGLQALDALRAHLYDLIIMDLVMPVMDGYTTAERIRSGVVPGQRGVPIVAYTADASHLARIHAEKAGIHGFVAKPCTRLDLLEALKRSLDKAADQTLSEAEKDELLKDKVFILADDQMLNRKVAGRCMELWGMKAIEADHGRAVMEILESGEHQVDGILMDMEMPVLSGLEAAQLIRGNKAWSRLPIIALTAHVGDRYVASALAAGMTDFISRPLDREVLREKLVAVLKGKGLSPA